MSEMCFLLLGYLVGKADFKQIAEEYDWDWGFPVALVVKNLLASARDLRDTGSSPGLGRSLEGGRGNHSSVLAWRIPWTKEPGWLQSVGLQRVRHD